LKSMRFFLFHLILSSLLSQFLSCTTNNDCQLNGVCTSSKCLCDSGWEGDGCGILSLIPAKTNAGFRQSDSYSWCGTVIPDSKTTGLYHLFASEMGDHCNLDVWRTDSQIVQATSQGDPTGPYTRQNVTVAPEAHNPQAIQAPDGTYIIFDSYGGPVACPTKTNTTTCTSITHCPCVGPGVGNFTFHYATTPAGPWSSSTVSMPYPCYSCNLTPTPWFHPNGTLFIIFHCDDDATHSQCDLTMVQAPSWKGPYSMVNNGKSIWSVTQSPGHPEDPFLWMDKRGGWHIIMHNGPHGIHVYSHDGLTWTIANNNTAPYPYTTNITTVSGVVTVNRRERPWMLLNSAGNPTLLVTSVEPQSGPDYTHAQAINA